MSAARRLVPLSLALSMMFAGVTAHAGPSTATTPAKPGLFAKIGTSFREYREYRAAKKDFKSWTKEKGHEDIRTFNRGARKDAHIVASKIVGHWNAFNAGVAGAMTVAAPNPISAALSIVSLGSAVHLLNQATQDEQRVNTRTLTMAITHPGTQLDSARIDRWIKAGIVAAPTK